MLLEFLTGIKKELGMKWIDAVIRQESLDNVRERLTDLGVEDLTVTEAIGFGHQKAVAHFIKGVSTA
jgi:nitrogen regulatory protein PII